MLPTPFGVAAADCRGVKQGAGCETGVCKTGRNTAHSRRGPKSPAEAGSRCGSSFGDDRMSGNGKRRHDGNASWVFRKLRAEAEIAERQLAEMPMRRVLEVAKVSVAIVGVVIAMIVMFDNIGLFS